MIKIHRALEFAVRGRMAPSRVLTGNPLGPAGAGDRLGHVAARHRHVPGAAELVLVVGHVVLVDG